MVICEPLPRGCEAADARVLLVVEDEWLIRMSVVDALRSAGWCVREASSAAEALEMLRGAGRIDLVLTDMRMLGPMDGLEVLAVSQEVRPGMPVVVVSAHLDPEAALAAGASAVLAKPYRMDALLDIVRALHRPGGPAGA